MRPMPLAGLAVGAVLALVLQSRVVQAEPTFGVPCSGCHVSSTNRMTITGNDTTAALSGRLDGGTSSLLKVFTVTAGGTATLTINVTDGNLLYDPVIYHLDAGGVENSAANHLSFTNDALWAGDHSAAPPPGTGPYFTFALDGISWLGSETSYVYQLHVLPGTPDDYYSVLFGVAGRLPSAVPQQWSQFEEVYVHVVSVPEPATILVLVLGLGALALRRWGHV